MLDATTKFKATGITPMAVGGSEKWPLQLYPALLMMRIPGRKGWHLDPFQEGFQTTKAREAASLLHNGKAAFHLQAGAWVRPNPQITVQNTVHDNSEHIARRRAAIAPISEFKNLFLCYLGRRKQERRPRPNIRA